MYNAQSLGGTNADPFEIRVEDTLLVKERLAYQTTP